jgi:hypothetical protein
MAAGRERTPEEYEAEQLEAEQELARMVLDDDTPEPVKAAIFFRVGASVAAPSNQHVDVGEIKR